MSSKYKITNPEGVYFITFSVVQWVDVFSRAIYKHILIDSLQYCIKNKGLRLFSYVIMTNHVHLIASANQAYNLSDILRDLKKYTSKKIIKEIRENSQESRRKWLIWIFKSRGEKNSNNKSYQFWRQDNHPIELVDSEMFKQKLEYIHNNPVKEEFVEKPENYKYSSAVNYAGEKGVIDIELL